MSDLEFQHGQTYCLSPSSFSLNRLVQLNGWWDPLFLSQYLTIAAHVYCICVLYVCIVYVYCMCVLYMCIVYVYCICVLYMCIVYVYLYVYCRYMCIVYVYCICVLYMCIVYVYCICVLYMCIVYVYCVCVLYMCIVYVYYVYCICVLCVVYYTYTVHILYYDWLHLWRTPLLFQALPGSEATRNDTKIPFTANKKQIKDHLQFSYSESEFFPPPPNKKLHN